jgi:hypothetical protein
LPSAALAPISLSMSFVVFFQSDAGRLRVVGDDDGRAREFPNRDDALLHTEQVRLPGTEHVDWEIVELDEP